MSEIPQTPTGCNIRALKARQIVVTLLRCGDDRAAQKGALLFGYEIGMIDAEQTERFMRTFGLRSA